MNPDTVRAAARVLVDADRELAVDLVAVLHGLVSLERAAALDDTAAAVALRLRTFRDALRQSLQETM